jgi:hypothetical protein
LTRRRSCTLRRGDADPYDHFASIVEYLQKLTRPAKLLRNVGQRNPNRRGRRENGRFLTPYFTIGGNQPQGHFLHGVHFLDNDQQYVRSVYRWQKKAGIGE